MWGLGSTRSPLLGLSMVDWIPLCACASSLGSTLRPSTPVICPRTCATRPSPHIYIYLTTQLLCAQKSHLYALWHSIPSTLTVFIFARFLFQWFLCIVFTSFLRSFSCIIAVERQTFGLWTIKHFFLALYYSSLPLHFKVFCLFTTFIILQCTYCCPAGYSQLVFCSIFFYLKFSHPIAFNSCVSYSFLLLFK